MQKKGLWVILFTVLALLLIVGAASAAASSAPLNYSGSPRSGYYCSGTNTTNHPVGDKLAGEFEVTYQEIMDRFCLEGYGFGEIMVAYRIAEQAGVSTSEVFDMRATGVGWGSIMKSYGLHGMSGKTIATTTTTATTTTSTTTISTTPVPPQSNGNGNGNGSGNGNGNGSGNGNGKGQGNGKAKGKNK